MDETLLSEATEIADKRGGGSWMGPGATRDDALLKFAEGLSEDSSMIERLATEVARLTKEVNDLRGK